MSAITQFRRRLTRIGYGRLATVIVLLVVALLAARFTWQVSLAVDAERAMYDVRDVLSMRRVDQDPRILMVVYKDETLERTGRRSPLDRALLARALTALDGLGARAIGIDILVDQPEPEDVLLARALRGMRTPTYFAFAANRTNPDTMPYWQEQVERRFFRSLAGSRVRPASIRIEADPDGVMRSWPNRPPGLPPLLVDRLAGGSGSFADYQRSIVFRLPQIADRGVFEELQIDLFDDPATAAMLRSQVAGRIVLIGGDLTDSDRFDTPATRLLHAPDPKAAGDRTISGLEVHATLLAQRLDHAQPIAIPAALLWLAAFLVVLIGTAVGLLDIGGWRLALMLVVSIGLIVLLPFTLQGGGIDTQGLPAFGWLVGWALAYSSSAVAARRLGSEQRRFAQGALGRYLPPDIAAAILRDPDQLKLHGERRTIFALFSDLEGFTKLTHAIAPEMTAFLLNRYLDRLSSIVLAHGGTVDKFVGDAVVAFWGAPISRADDGDRALAAAMAMVEAGEQFRREAPDGVPPIGRTRVGLHRGEAIIGNFGGEGRIQYTALGDAMNTAARMEGANKKLATRALVSAEAKAAMTDPPLRPVGRVTVRGRSTPLAVFEPVPEQSRAEIEELSAIMDRFERGDPDSLVSLSTYALARSNDNALQTLLEHSRKVGPGGYFALD